MHLFKCLILGICLFSLTASSTANDANTAGQTGIVRTLSAFTSGQTGLNVGGGFKYAFDREYVNSVAGSSVDPGVSHLISGNLYVSFGVAKFLDIGLDFPAYYDKISDIDIRRRGIGDLGLSIKLSNPFQKENSPLVHGYYLKVLFPTGTNMRGLFPRNSYYIIQSSGSSVNSLSTGNVLFNPMMLWSINFLNNSSQMSLKMHLNAGGVVGFTRGTTALTGALGVEFSPATIITLFTEVSGESRLKFYTEKFDASYVNNDPVRLSPGARFNFPSGLYLLLAGDFSLSDKSAEIRSNWKNNGYRYSTNVLPRYGMQLTFGWSGILKEPDTDKDGIIDKNDKCPNDPEDKDGFADDDGCPDPDNDGDGIPDILDECPLQAAKCSGCPVLDADNDGIPDENDKCPNEPEDKDGFEDEDGCPDLDNDNDGIPDENDKCPNEPEDKDGFEDSDGCPDYDNDGDGVDDLSDKCPGVKGLPENDGCPKTQEIQRGKLILSGVTFMSGKAVLNSNSYTILDQVYESLNEWHEVKLEIQGHTDNLGSDVVNLKLSQARAEAVRDYLIQKGISPERLRAIGYGKDFPIADNTTAAGREKNRRVELHRID